MAELAAPAPAAARGRGRGQALGRYLAVRLAHSVFVVWAAYTLSFVILYLVPGDPVEMMVSSSGVISVTSQQIAQLRAEYGVDRSPPAQYLTNLWDALHLDFGRSLQRGQSALDIIGGALPSTIELAGAALVVAALVGWALALGATATRARSTQRFLLALPALGVAVPSFWIGLVLLQVLSFHWHLLPAFGDTGPRGLILPAVTLAVPTAAFLARMLAASLWRVLADPHVTTARAKGLGRWRIHQRHALRNALPPVLAVAGVLVGNLLAGSVVVETVFSRPGLGRVVEAAVTSKDIPVVQALVVFFAVVFVTVNLLVDLAHPLLDPQVTLTGTRRR
ncbi:MULTISPECIES: ABC transporter permease [Frankia]|uniref:ABC transporter component, permease protein n=1 Tax=Frankia alni (strain DSM 45986 / CECT 9034 / ACN14a) TaxID=326424 RepID=Q0RIC6_FRAAA|nr:MULTISPECIES: ABC transporter permease [Frankia]CAJ62744.1 putative ABC transporter component, permease protein [Frankia alni ACN14a]